MKWLTTWSTLTFMWIIEFSKKKPSNSLKMNYKHSKLCFQLSNSEHENTENVMNWKIVDKVDPIIMKRF